MARIAEFERELTLERVHAGLKGAQARGQVLGRKPGLPPISGARRRA
jgi:putative DNA-invertase from lambdoid prophage Rac